MSDIFSVRKIYSFLRDFRLADPRAMLSAVGSAGTVQNPDYLSAGRPNFPRRSTSGAMRRAKSTPRRELSETKRQMVYKQQGFVPFGADFNESARRAKDNARVG
eukprot:1371215-Amorphochlora_amoeboformis.AAC.2